MIRRPRKLFEVTDCNGPFAAANASLDGPCVKRPARSGISGGQPWSRVILIGRSGQPIANNLNLVRHCMRPINRIALGSLLFIGSMIPTPAQDKPFDPLAPSGVAPVTPPPTTLTGKERLGRKWMDEQRIDNCKVPTDKRGTTPRPSSCEAGPTG